MLLVKTGKVSKILCIPACWFSLIWWRLVGMIMIHTCIIRTCRLRVKFGEWWVSIAFLKCIFGFLCALQARLPFWGMTASDTHAFRIHQLHATSSGGGCHENQFIHHHVEVPEPDERPLWFGGSWRRILVRSLHIWDVLASCTQWGLWRISGYLWDMSMLWQVLPTIMNGLALTEVRSLAGVDIILIDDGMQHYSTVGKFHNGSKHKMNVLV